MSCRNQIKIQKFCLCYLLITLQFFFSIVSTEPASQGNTSLLLNEEFVTITRNYIHLKIDELNYENINDDQIRWKFFNPIQDGGGGKKPPHPPPPDFPL